ncbi:MAG TPA: VWA domain-containing protein [Ignavibacteria bacterium]|nr:VWA domain-containing protein [Ignavibacteria bacterium]HMR41999.1 VWA domain-containing protein [Ignavibacteria bacterium]
MKTIIFLLFISLIIGQPVYSNGVAVINASTGTYLKLNGTQIDVSVELQISVTRSTQLFLNNSAQNQIIAFAFPIPQGASATSLRWLVNGEWHTAVISPTPQDTSLPGGTMNQNLRNYLGANPLFFRIPDTIRRDSLLIVEMTYVQLLNYDFGNVYYDYKNDYRNIQNQTVEYQELTFNLNSPRNIDSIRLVSSNPLTQLINNGNNAAVISNQYTAVPSVDFKIKYSLDLSELGLYSYSTGIPDSLLPDTLGGFFSFIAEPDPGNTNEVIKKVFTLVLDRSGSMSGNKIIQAKNAANFIVNNLNTGDKFNIVDFETNVYSFRPQHVLYTVQTRDSALSYINNINAGGGTNISGAFSSAVPQFNAANDSTANIIIFLTDGLPTVGISNTTELLSHIRNLIELTETHIYLYSFGIGTDVDQQLLTLMSSQNSGYAEFLLNDELESRITNFYLRIKNPVLLSPEISFSSPNINSVYPDPLPNLYIGQQMIVAGRYTEPGPVLVTLSGRAFNHPVSYQYNINRIDSADSRYQFLTKIWAKQKIENLLIDYYSLNPNSPEALALKQQIIQLSISYGVITVFTSFGNPSSIEEEISGNDVNNPEDYNLTGNYPNPFNPQTTIKFIVNNNLHGLVMIRIYNSAGKLVDVMSVVINGKGAYEIKWNGEGFSSGVYFYTIDFGDKILRSKMMLLK